MNQAVDRACVELSFVGGTGQSTVVSKGQRRVSESEEEGANPGKKKKAYRSPRHLKRSRVRQQWYSVKAQRCQQECAGDDNNPSRDEEP